MASSIAIVGAGPAGLTLARLLEINGIDYTLFERDGSPDEVGQGGSLDIHKHSGQLALEKAGLMEAFNRYARYEGQNKKMVDQHGQLVWERKDGGQRDKPEIDRKDLRALLLKSVPSEKVCWDCKVASIEKRFDGSVAITFADGDVRDGFRLVVGADGAWSEVRALITSAKPRYSGYHYLQSSISPSHPYYSKVSSQVGKGSFLILGGGKQIAAQCTGDGSYNIYLGLPLPEHWKRTQCDSDGAKLRDQLVQEEFSGWSHDLTDLIRSCDGKFHSWPLYALPAESLPWEQVSGLTLIGDAAHLSTPFVGEGVNCSMYDSLQLAQEIIESEVGCLDEAVARYETGMFPRAIDLITRSAATGDLLFAQDATERWKAMIAKLQSS